MKHEPIKIPLVVVIAVGALACVSLGMFLNSLRGRLVQAEANLTVEALGYPDTGFVLPRPLDQQIVQVAHFSNGSPALQALAYEDVVHPDEDLLRPGTSASVQPSLDSTPSAPRPTEAEVLAPAAPEPQILPSEPMSVPQQPTGTPAPTTAPEQAPPASSSWSPSAADEPSGKTYDLHAGPAPDEDLLWPDRPPDQPPREEIPANPSRQLSPTRPSPSTRIDADATRLRTEGAAPLPTSQQSDEPSMEVLPDRPIPAPAEPQSQPSDWPRPNAGPYAPHSTGNPPTAVYGGTGDPHAAVFAETLFPSAKACRDCHETIYEEWASSSHAYAAISPMYQKFEQALNVLTKGTVGYFCMRCHAPVATTLSLPREASIYTTIPSGVEGVTCIACHRVVEEYGKVNGERRIEPGTVNDPVLGSGYGAGLAEVLAKKDYYKVKTGPEDKGPGYQIHQRVIQFEQLSSSHFCVSCHQVAVYPGIKLEVVWEQYRASPAHKQGITCQECHMGQEPGMPQGYTTGPVAIVNGKEISSQQKHSNHMFYGPGYSIAHPGTFPFHPDAEDWTIEEWLQFDYRAGWGSEEFEDLVADREVPGAFPKAWESSDDRMDAREIVDANLKKLELKRALRRRLMENNSGVDGPIFRRQPCVGRPLEFHYVVENRNIGHNMPSGSLGAQPQIWLNVALSGPDGRHLWESGYVDANGDLADLHSLEVAAGRIRRDQQLFNLQSKFLITHVKGTDREMYLPINIDFDQLPFIRPSGFPITVMNHPPFIRMEAHSLPPLGSRKATYRVPAKRITRPGHYRLSVRMRSRAEPIYFMRYCQATPEMERNMNEWMLDFHEDYFDFYVAP